MRLIDTDEVLQDLEGVGTMTDNIGQYIDIIMLYDSQNNVIKNQPIATMWADSECNEAWQDYVDEGEIYEID